VENRPGAVNGNMMLTSPLYKNPKFGVEFARTGRTRPRSIAAGPRRQLVPHLESETGPQGPVSLSCRPQWNSAGWCVERETSLELATSTLARLRSTN
jgi:hypothetical protein